ncbi:MAG: dynamin family protein, partial [Bacteroidales bacterium]|nr:dynamin family protein [Bacteroidales bacterium]
MTRKIKDQNIDDKIINLANRISELESVKDSEFYKNQLTNIKSEIRHKVFRITVVGEFSSGKSTFLNALIGKDILPHAVSETTATITYIHNVPADDKMENKAVVHFNEQGRKDETIDIVKDSQKFQDYLSALNKNGDNIVKLVQSVDVYVNFTDLDEPIVFVDTPGLNGVADGHRDITIREISRSHASICLFPIRGIGQTDLTFMRELMKYQNTFFFVINQIDTLNRQEEPPEERILTFKEEVKNNIYNGTIEPEYVFGISGLKALVGRDKQIDYLYMEDKENGRRITDEERKQYLEDSRFALLEDALFKYLSGNEKDSEIYYSMIRSLQTILDDVESQRRELLEIYKAEPSELPEEKWLKDELNRLLRDNNKNRNDFLNSVGSQMNDFSSNLRKSILRDCENKSAKFNDKIDPLNKVEDIKKFSVGEATTAFYAEKCSDIKDKIENISEEILKKSFKEINDLMPRFNFQKKGVDEKAIKLTLQNEETYDDGGRINELKRQGKELTQQIAATKSAKIDAENMVGQLTSEKSSLEAERAKEIRAANSRKRSWDETITETKPVEQKGFFGRLKRFAGDLFGTNWGYDEETIEKKITRNNYAEIEAEKQQIEKRYGSQINQLRKDLNTYQEILDTNIGNLEFLQRKKDETEK